MTRLFDAGAEMKEASLARASREAVKQRADEVTRLLEEELQLDDASKKLGENLAATATSVQPIHYHQFRGRGSKWMIEHARAGDDYMYQLFPLKPPAIAWADIITMFIAVMDAIFPRSVHIHYVPPNDNFQIKFYTIKLENIAVLPGWETPCKERALHGLANVDAWSR
jgi:hypothetical protein